MAQSSFPVAEKGTRRRLIALGHDEARDFLLKHESYLTLDIPQYFQFGGLLNDVATLLDDNPIPDKPGAGRFDRVNHRLLSNKDGRHAWRPIELVHPALYVSLVNRMTQPEHWERICSLFREFQTDPHIQCLSLPVESLTRQTDKATQISGWWEDVEQKSLELSLDYEFLVRTDIVDCYSSIYTHSIAWAVHTKGEAKKFRTNQALVGNFIDTYIQGMSGGQTNGIPQGSVLMDFIAEMVLGYADMDLVQRLQSEDDCLDYQILRYRDDYRLFVNTIKEGEIVLKCLTEVLIDLGLRLNPRKTSTSSEVIQGSIKSDKLDWILRGRRPRNLQKYLLTIHEHGRNYPNAGRVAAEMVNFHRRILKVTELSQREALPLISIVSDIAYNNPKVYPIATAILSKLVYFLGSPEEKKRIIGKILKKFSRTPNIGHLEIWLQRISYGFGSGNAFKEPLCLVVERECNMLWNNEWLENQGIQEAVDASRIVDWEALANMEPIVPMGEVELFQGEY